MPSSSSNNRKRGGEPPYYRPCVGAVLFNPQGLVWVGKRISEPGNTLDYAWQMPQGGIDVGEDPRLAVFRELLEETGTDRAEIVRESVDWLRYDLPEQYTKSTRKGQFRGQTQKWFALRYNGTDSEFNLNFHEKPEFSEWRWTRLEAVPELIVPFKRDVYKSVVAEFEDLPERIANE